MLALLAACLLHDCSNDTLGVFGDERVSWSPAVGTVTAYEVWRSGDAEPCLIVAGDPTSIRVAGTACLAYRDDRPPSADTDRIYELRVRACNGTDAGSPARCGGLSGAVAFVVPSCLEHAAPCMLPPDGTESCPTCERRCYSDQPLPLPLSQRYEACP